MSRIRFLKAPQLLDQGTLKEQFGREHPAYIPRTIAAGGAQSRSAITGPTSRLGPEPSVTNTRGCLESLAGPPGRIDSVQAGIDLRDTQIAARLADPSIATHVDRHPNYILAAYMSSGT